MIKKSFFALLISLFAVFSYMRCGTENTTGQETYAALNDTVKYVGMNTCKECHQDIYNSYIRTGMGQSFANASPQKSAANFISNKPVYDPHNNMYYVAYWDKDSLRLKEYRLDGKDTIHHRTETITYIVGSGQHTNSHIINLNGYLHQAPLTFYTQQKIWDLPPGFENGNNTRFSRLIGLECMSCHNSYPRMVLGSENKYEFVDNGIDCERCHGPGEKHVADKKRGKMIDITTAIDYSIVNPSKLSVDLQFDVCQRCHIQGNAVLREGKSFFDFKPSMHLSEVMDVYMPVYEGREQEHIMASHAERLKQSKCFVATMEKINTSAKDQLKPYKNALTCITCHNPHVSVKESAPDFFNNTCKGCHSGTVPCPAPELKRMAKNNDCITCHMPKSGAIDIPHVSVHDHRIAIPAEEVAENSAKIFKGISCINNPNPDDVSKAKAFIAYFEKFNFGKEVLDSAKKYLPSSTDNDIRKHFKNLVHLSYLQQDYNAIISYVSKIDTGALELNQTYDNGDAWTCYRIGEAYTATGNETAAAYWFSKSYSLAPLYPEFANKYGVAAFQSGNTARALEVLQQSTGDYSWFPPSLSNFGYMKLLYSGDTTGVMAKYNRAIDLDPDYAQAVLNKAGLLISTGNKKAAKITLEDFLKLHPENNKARLLVKLAGE